MKFKKTLTTAAVIGLIAFSQTSVAAELYEPKNITLYQSEFGLENNASVTAASQYNEYDIAGSTRDIPIKVLGVTVGTKKVNIIADKEVLLGGQTVGVAMYTDGLFVTDTVAVEDEKGNFVSPAKDAGIKKGDYIISANGIKLEEVSNLDAVVRSSSGKVSLTIKRNGNEFKTDLETITGSDGQKKLGMWLRDSAAGLGTITYVDGKNYGALGHGISDADTGEILKVGKGRIVECNIDGAQKGERGKAGELKGSFGVNASVLGTIEQNGRFGLFGKIDASFKAGEKIKLGSKEKVHQGKAEIYSTIDNTGVKKYEIEIIRVNSQTVPEEKSMVIKVTDAALLEKTGGIVQGMSGSPIVQDGRLIGAVTHVMINDPSTGYGIFIENMLEASNKQKAA